ncbi:unnamed protein product [Ceratitis capitata]|uniref:(Mediterranean fruit fly) hypothetical protein n=1 Tax=Ceratitis capitata TaxID=7213 RepID=A0A811USA7_CERCA|nr:unnamed protein product [Ceratitis capitata]
MLLPDETYDEHIEHATVATADQQQLEQGSPSTALNSNQTRKLKNSKTKANQPSYQRLHNASLSGSAEATSGSASSDSRFSGSGIVSFPYSTSSFFTNILDNLGDILPQIAEFTQKAQGAQNRIAESPLESASVSLSSSESAEGAGAGAENSEHLTAHADVLRVVCDNFLRRHRIRPDFFCQYQQAISATKTKPKNATTATIACAQPITVAAKPTCVRETEANGVTINSEELTAELQWQRQRQRQQQMQQQNAELRNLYTLPLVKRKKACNTIETTATITRTSAAAAAASDASSGPAHVAMCNSHTDRNSRFWPVKSDHPDALSRSRA